MEMTPEQAAIVAKAVRARREFQKLTQKQVAEAGGTSDQTVMFLERGEQLRYQNRSIGAVEVGLNWPDGAIQDIARGVDPDDIGTVLRVQPAVRDRIAPPPTVAAGPPPGRLGEGVMPGYDLYTLFERVGEELRLLGEGVELMPEADSIVESQHRRDAGVSMLKALLEDVEKFATTVTETIDALEQKVD